ncbi:hypothetical protein ES705_11739 [subsurface metagenome]
MVTKLKQMRAEVLKELQYIPDWPYPQGELRMAYWSWRMNSLGKKATIIKSATQILNECITNLKRDYPDFKFKYDENFFNQK